MQTNIEEDLNPEHNLCSEAQTIHHSHTHLKPSDDTEHEDVEREENESDDEEEEEDEEEFSFMCGGANTSPIAAEDAFVDGQIKPIFPLFNRELFFSAKNSRSLHENLPMGGKPAVKKVLVETGEEINAQ